MQNFTLDNFQSQALESAKKGNSVIVSAPTGAGKTLIAERIIEDCIKNQKGVVYTAPIKALSNQKFRDFSKKYPGKVGILTGDVSINRSAPILIMTTEIFRNAILVEPESFAERGWVIFDEIHYLDDIERGTVWEETIILLPPKMRLLALSATLPNIKEFVGWLKKVHSHPVESIVEETRPVPLHFFFQCNDNLFSSFKELKKSDLLYKTLRKQSYQENYWHSKPNKLKTLIKHLNGFKTFPCVYFSFSRRRCEDLAQDMGYLDFLNPSEKNLIDKTLNELIEKFNISPSTHVNFLIPLIKNGIAYHHAGLLPTLKEVIERLFTTGLIKFIFTTETFALGVNMPAKAVVFDTLSKFYGHYHGYLKTRDFYQMAGRSGRRGIDKEGFVFSRINPSHIDKASLEKIIYGGYEPIKSQLNSCYATILNLYKLMAERIYDIYPNSFHCYQSKMWEKKEIKGLLRRKMSLLKQLGYIKNGLITEKAILAAKVYSFELSVGELFAGKYFDACDGESLFTTITALVYEPRKGEMRPRLNKRAKGIKKDLNKSIKQIHRKERSFRISPLSKKPFFHLFESSSLWYQGVSFSRLQNTCSIDEGEIVRYFRMSIQVLRQIHSSKVISASLKQKLGNCLKKVNRDVIDAEKQLRQDL